MDNVYLYRGKRPSQGGRKVGEALGAKIVKCKNSDYKVKDGHTVINWGNSGHIPADYHHPHLVKVINKPHKVGIAANKLETFNILKDANVSIPEYATNRNMVTKDHTWFARHSLTGSGGEGIEIIRPGDRVPDAPLYVRYIKAEYEVRVHATKNRVLSFQQKLKKKDQDDPSKGMIKNHGNGYVFVRNGINAPQDVCEVCKQEGIKAVFALGLDFGAVDIIYSGGKAYVLEVNTSPGVEGTTLDDYVTMLKEMIYVER